MFYITDFYDILRGNEAQNKATRFMNKGHPGPASNSTLVWRENSAKTFCILTKYPGPKMFQFLSSPVLSVGIIIFCIIMEDPSEKEIPLVNVTFFYLSRTSSLQLEYRNVRTIKRTITRLI